MIYGFLNDIWFLVTAAGITSKLSSKSILVQKVIGFAYIMSKMWWSKFYDQKTVGRSFGKYRAKSNIVKNLLWKEVVLAEEIWKQRILTYIWK